MHDCIINIVEIDILNATARVPMHSFAQMFCIFLLLLVSIPCQKKNSITIIISYFSNRFIPVYVYLLQTIKCTFQTNIMNAVWIEYYFCKPNGPLFVWPFSTFQLVIFEPQCFKFVFVEVGFALFSFCFFGTLNIERIIDE